MNEVIEREYAFSLEIMAMKIELFKAEGYELASGKPEKSCGTVACMMGWSGQDPWHKKQGLKISINNYDCQYDNYYGIEQIIAKSDS